MGGEKRILLVLNPVSGGRDKQEFLYYARSHAADGRYALFDYFTSGDRDSEKIRDLITELRPDRVIAAGGDGTISQVALALNGRRHITLGMMPLGSANGLAVNFRIPSEVPAAWRLALEGPPQAVDGVEINGVLSLHLSDLGLNALLVKKFSSGETRGKLGYAREFLKSLKENKVFKTRIYCDGQTLESENSVVIVANAEKYGTGFRINPGGIINDGFFELIVVKPVNMLDVTTLWTTGMDFRPELVTVFKTRYAAIEVLDQDVPFQVDGEYMGDVRRVAARILPAFLSVALPP